MEESKNNNTGLLIIICLLIGVAGFLGGRVLSIENRVNEIEVTNNNVENKSEKKEEVKQEENCSTSESKNYFHVFSTVIDSNGYDIYAYLENQDNISTIVDYKGELYYINGNQTECVSNLNKGVKFNDKNKASCSNDENSGQIVRLNVKTNDIANAYILESYDANDGRDAIILVFKDGTVNRYGFVENGYSVKDLFNGEKVKEINKYECSSGKESCAKEKFTVLLQDGSTKEIEKSINYY